MKRREFIAGLAVAAILPRAARGQQPATMKRIAMVGTAIKVADMRVGGAAIFRAFSEELSRRGFVEGENLVVERYSGEGRIEHYADLAREVISTHPDLIFAVGGIPMALHFKSMTTTIPIVTASGDPIAMGLVPSLARPGGNVTGVSTDGDVKFYGKRLGLLAEGNTEAFQGWLSCIAAQLGIAHRLSEGSPGGSGACWRFFNRHSVGDGVQ